MIQARRILKKFDNLTVLRGIDLDVHRGEIVSIVGPSGAGKSTLLQILGSLSRPDSGSVNFDGTDIFAMSDTRLARFRMPTSGSCFSFTSCCPNSPWRRMWPCPP